MEPLTFRREIFGLLLLVKIKGRKRVIVKKLCLALTRDIPKDNAL